MEDVISKQCQGDPGMAQKVIDSKILPCIKLGTLSRYVQITQEGLSS